MLSEDVVEQPPKALPVTEAAHEKARATKAALACSGVAQNGLADRPGEVEMKREDDRLGGWPGHVAAASSAKATSGYK